VLGFGRPVIDIVRGAGIFESLRPEAFAIGDGFFDERYGRPASPWRGELDAVAGQDGVSLVGNGLDQSPQEVARCCGFGALVEVGERELARLVGRDGSPCRDG